MKRDALRILAIEDNPADLRLLTEQLREDASTDFEVVQAGTLKRALELLPTGDFAVVLLDLNLPDSRGMEGLERILEAKQTPPVIVLTGLSDVETGLVALSRNAQDYLVKGKIDSDGLIRSIRYAIERDKAEKAVRRINVELEHRVADQTLEIRADKDMLEKRVATRTAELQVANEELRASRVAALNLMEDALEARQKAEQISIELTRAMEKIRRNMEELEQREREYRQLMEEASDGIALTDKDGNLLAANARLCEILGYSKTEISSLQASNLVHPEDLPSVLRQYEQTPSGKASVAEHRVRRKDGSYLLCGNKCKTACGWKLPAFFATSPSARKPKKNSPGR